MPSTTHKRPDGKWILSGVRFVRLKPAPEKPVAYTLRVYLTGAPYHVEWDDWIWRDIVVEAGDTLDDLHWAIFGAFDRDDEHLYEFNLGKGPRERRGRYMPTEGNGWGPEDAENSDVALDALGLQVGRRFGYRFDFGDDWTHVVEVREIHESKPKGKLPRVIAEQGKSPEQYPDYDE